MSLRSFILSISAFIIITMVGLFYFQTQKILGGAFEDLEKVQLETVRQTTESLLETRKYSLQTYRSLLENNNSLSSVLLVATAHHRSEKILRRLEALQTSLKVDLVDFIPHGSTPIRYKEIPVPKGSSSWEVSSVQKQVALLSFSPVRHYGEQIGTLVLGFYLNTTLSEQILRTTRARVHFEVTPLLSEGHTNLVTFDGHANPAKQLPLSIETNFIHELNRTTRSGITWLGIASMLLVLFFLYALLEFGFVRSFKELLNSILRVASDLDRGIVRETPAVSHPIKEVDNLGQSFSKFSVSLKSFKERIESQSRASAFAEVAEQVAHDLKSPISALDMMLSSENLVELPDHRRNRIQACIQRIKDTIRVLSAKRKEGLAPLASKIDPEHPIPAPHTSTRELLSTLVENMVQEKRIQYRSMAQLQILFRVSPRAHFSFVEINSNDIKRAVSNLIDNAVQATGTTGRVEILLETSRAFLELTIRDNGRGIPIDVLPKLGNRGATFNKEGGSGLGLFWAKSVVENAAGRLEIRSKENCGTDVTLLLPLCTPPDWFLPALRLPSGSTIVVIDDDPSIHEMWVQKMAPLAGNLQLVQFMSGSELERWLQAHPDREGQNTFFLFDYDLAGDARNGLQWIAFLNLASRSVLVTSYDEKEEVRTEAGRLKVKLIPKGISGFVPIEVLPSSAFDSRGGER